MLSTFSTYDKGSLEKIHNAWAQVANYSIFPGKEDKGGVTATGKMSSEFTRDGAERQPAEEPVHAGVPQSMGQSITNDAYSDRRVFYIPSSRLFFGNGCSLMPAGKTHLKLLASFLKAMPCQVVIMESAPNADADAMMQRGLERSWVIIDYFVREGAISAGRFRVKTPTSEIAQRTGGRAVMEITLLARGL